MNSQTFIATIENSRIDKVVSEELSISRSQIQQLLKQGLIFVNGVVVKSNYKVKLNDKITVHFKEVEALNVEAENLPLDIIYEDEDIVVVNKPSGMVVHPSKNHYNGTLVNALLYHIKELSTGTGEARPGIVHRIDKDTSGLLVIAKHNQAHQLLSKQLEEHTMTREYIALVNGIIEEEQGTIDAPLARNKNNRLEYCVNENGKKAVTHFKVLKRYKNYTLVSLKLETGRTHQIRVHMQFINHELVGDPIYSKVNDDKINGQFLHAKVLGFLHPSTKQYMEFQSELPLFFKEKLATLNDKI